MQRIARTSLPRSILYLVLHSQPATFFTSTFWTTRLITLVAYFQHILRWTQLRCGGSHGHRRILICYICCVTMYACSVVSTTTRLETTYNDTHTERSLTPAPAPYKRSTSTPLMIGSYKIPTGKTPRTGAPLKLAANIQASTLHSTTHPTAAAGRHGLHRTALPAHAL